MNKLYSFLYYLIGAVFAVFHPWRAVGNTKMPENGVLICGNHSTLSDPLFAMLCLTNRQQCRVMAKIELKSVPLVGFVMRKVDVIFVDRGKADVQAIKAAMKALKNGERVLMFPEGTRVEEGQEGQAQTGAAMLATRTGVPIVPVYIPRKKKWFRKTSVVFGDPYMPEFEGKKPTPEDYERISADLMNRIYALEALAK